MKTLAFLFVSVLTLSVVASCAPHGPVAPVPVRAVPAPVLIDPVLIDALRIPGTNPPVTTHTADGRMQFDFHLENHTDRNIALQLRATFYDEAGVTVDERLMPTDFIQMNYRKAFSVTATNKQAKSVTVQVAPAR